MLPIERVPALAVPALASRLTCPPFDRRLRLASAMLPPDALAPVMAKLVRQPLGQATLAEPGDSAGRLLLLLPLTVKLTPAAMVTAPPPIVVLEALIV